MEKILDISEINNDETAVGEELGNLKYHINTITATMRELENRDNLEEKLDIVLYKDELSNTLSNSMKVSDIVAKIKNRLDMYFEHGKDCIRFEDSKTIIADNYLDVDINRLNKLRDRFTTEYDNLSINMKTMNDIFSLGMYNNTNLHRKVTNLYKEGIITIEQVDLFTDKLEDISELLHDQLHKMSQDDEVYNDDRTQPIDINNPNSKFKFYFDEYIEQVNTLNKELDQLADNKQS